MTPDKKTVYIATPTYDGTVLGTTLEAVHKACNAPDISIIHEVDVAGCSVIHHGFNKFWCFALNMKPRPNWFCMLHADIRPEPGWLTKLLRLAIQYDAGMLSALVPLKDNTDDYSACWLEENKFGNLPYPIRRINKKDLKELPPTFDYKMAGWPNFLGTNTGCCLWNFERSWVEKVHFAIPTDIVQGDDGIFRPVMLSEDWLMSYVLQKQFKETVMATSVVKLKHRGIKDYDSDCGFISNAELAS